MAEQNTNVTNTSEQQELGELLQIRRTRAAIPSRSQSLT